MFSSFSMCLSVCIRMCVCECLLFAVGSLIIYFIHFLICRSHIRLFIHSFAFTFCPVFTATCIIIYISLVYCARSAPSVFFCNQRSNLLRTISFFYVFNLCRLAVFLFFLFAWFFLLRLLSFRVFGYTHIYVFIHPYINNMYGICSDSIHKREQQK